MDHGNCLHHVDAMWHHTFLVPHLGFPVVHTDGRVEEPDVLQKPKNRTDPIRRTHDVNIVEEREQALVILELGLQSLKGGMLSQGKQCRH